jgi:hypothetical protein
MTPTPRGSTDRPILRCALVFGALSALLSPGVANADPLQSPSPDAGAASSSSEKGNPAESSPTPDTPARPKAQSDAEAPTKSSGGGLTDTIAKKAAEWFEKIKIRGYAQFRYNRIAETNENLVNVQGDRSIGKDGGLFIRRARVIIFGDVHEHVSVYLQSDFASTAGDQLHVTIMRDWYADIFPDKKKEFRFRIGQSKVPYGFENLQSSQNRLPFDRSDAINSALKDERDLGLFFYWAPESIRARYKHLVDSGLKGSGDYGVAGLGVYNGQTANQKEANNVPHVVARVAYPFQLGKQVVELGLGGYTGRFKIKKDEGIGGESEFRDMRAHASFVLYPQPIGLQVEYNIGRGPELNNGVITERPIHGGYAMAMVKIGDVIPYARAVLYEGGRKFETNAPRYSVRELELGIEWQVWKALELTAAYTFAERTAPAPPYQQESGRFLRLQVQANY